MTNLSRELSWTIPSPGDTIAGKYVVDGFCGRGGLAVVLSAMHAALDQRVAIKVLLPEWAGDAEVVRRFLREGRAATRIKSEHVVRVFDVGTLEDGAPYLVLEYLEGNNLEDVLRTWGPLPVSTAIDWVLQAAEAIAEGHAYGIIHRDLKPSNLFLTRRADGSACIKVIDFGISKVTDAAGGALSKLTRPTDVMGSPFYMAPEQLKASSDADARSDLWALGIVLHELLTGHPPFGGQSMPEVFATVLTQPAPRLSSICAGIPLDVERAVLRCLEKDPMGRFAQLAELARALAPYGTDVARASCARIERVLEGDVAPRATAPTPSPSLPPADDAAVFSLRLSEPYAVPRASVSGRIVFGAFVVLASLGGAAFFGMYHSVHPSPPRSEAAREQRAPAVVAPPPPAATPLGVVAGPAAATETPAVPSGGPPPPTAPPQVTAEPAPPQAPAPRASSFAATPAPSGRVPPAPRESVRPSSSFLAPPRASAPPPDAPRADDGQRRAPTATAPTPPAPAPTDANPYDPSESPPPPSTTADPFKDRQ